MLYVKSIAVLDRYREIMLGNQSKLWYLRHADKMRNCTVQKKKELIMWKESKSFYVGCVQWGFDREGWWHYMTRRMWKKGEE